MRVVQPRQIPWCAITCTLILVILILIYLAVIGSGIYGIVWGAENFSKYCESDEYTGTMMLINMSRHYYILHFDIYQGDKLIYKNYWIYVDTKHYDSTRYTIGENYTLYEDCESNNSKYGFNRFKTGNDWGIAILVISIDFMILAVILGALIIYGVILCTCNLWENIRKENNENEIEMEENV